MAVVARPFFSRHIRVICGAAGLACASCSTVDPGPNFVVPDEQFDADYFFCHVEPDFLVAKRCGPGDPAAGDPSGGCHFNPAAVSVMTLADHATVDCGGGDHPTTRGQIGAGSPAQANLQAATLEMSRDYLTAPLFVRATGSNHPRAVIAKDDSAVDVLRRWAERP